jgi:hypothetical protein
MNEENAIVKKANDLIEHARYDLSLTQEYLILYLISLIRTEDTDFQTYKIPIAKLIDLFGSTSLYTRIKYEAQNLLKKTITIEGVNENNKKFVLITAWFSSLQYIEGSGFIQVRFDPALKPYLLQLKERFTEYLLRYAIPLHSTHIIRIYELLKQYQHFGYRHFDLEEFKHLLALDNKPAYFSYGLIKQRILLPAIERISKYTDLEITGFKEEKLSRKVIGFTFYFKVKSASELPQTIEIDSNSIPKTHSEPSDIPNVPGFETTASVLEAPAIDSDTQEKRLNYLYMQIPERYRNLDVRDILKQFLYLPDEVIISNIKYTVSQKPENFNSYLYKALQGDFAKEYREKASLTKQQEELKEQQRLLEELQGFYISYFVYKTKVQMSTEERKGLREEAMKMIKEKKEHISDGLIQGTEYTILQQRLGITAPNNIEELQAFRNTHLKEYENIKKQLEQEQEYVEPEPEELKESKITKTFTLKDDPINRLVDERFSSILANKDSEEYQQFYFKAMQEIKRIKPDVDPSSVSEETLNSIIRHVIREQIMKEK